MRMIIGRMMLVGNVTFSVMHTSPLGTPDMSEVSIQRVHRRALAAFHPDRFRTLPVYERLYKEETFKLLNSLKR